MPEYNPDTHDPIIVDLQAFAFVRAYTNLDSDSFVNMYQSAIHAGYSHNYPRVIGHYFPKRRIKKLIKNMQNPLGKALAFTSILIAV